MFARPPVARKSNLAQPASSRGVFTLLSQSFVAVSPNYPPGMKELVAKIFSNGGALLGEYPINDREEY